MWLMGVVLFVFSFLVFVLYFKVKLVLVCGGIIYFLSYVFYMYVAIREEVVYDKIIVFEKCIAVRGTGGRAVRGGGCLVIFFN